MTEAEGNRFRAALYFAVKRSLDMTIAATMLIVLAPLLLIIAALIKADSRGPALFRQQRVGSCRQTVNGRPAWVRSPFDMLKFRSMLNGADQSLHREHVRAFVEGQLPISTDRIAAAKLASDPRITRVGRVLRRTSLDELPQLVNVLRGEMSLVGPRPVPSYEVDLYRSEFFERFEATPGLSGLWQVQGRGAVSCEEMIELDIAYVRSRSTRLDLQILLRTIPAVFSGRGAA